MSGFSSAEEAEAAFYAAFEEANVTRMMEIWSNSDHDVCVHPMGPCLRGHRLIAESWREVFREGPKMQVELSDIERHTYGETAVHTMHETISIQNSEQPSTLLITTNIYRQINERWYLIVHHASLSPDNINVSLLDAEDEEEEYDDDIEVVLDDKPLLH